MTPEQWREIKPILQCALELSPTERAGYLDSVEPALRAEVESLIHSYEGNNGLPDEPALGIRPTANPEASVRIGRRVGPYRTLALLGHGGMGSVWMAERVDGLFTRQVALKLIHPTLSGWLMT